MWKLCSKCIFVCFCLICIAVEKSSSDGIVYKTPCCNYRNTIPDIQKKTPDFIEANGFVAETHLVTTEDGYILSVHRISERQSKVEQNEVIKPFRPSVLLQHGIAAASDNWLLNGHKSFPYILANADYDVWLSDSRGNSYSKRHIKLSPKDPKFWDFSFHEQGVYDLAAIVDYILQTTGQKKIFYVGHSRGTTSAFALLSTRPEYNKKFRLVVNFAPVAYLKHSKSPILRALFDKTSSEHLKTFFWNARSFALPGLNSRMTQLRKFFCGQKAATQPLCIRTIFLLVGFDYDLFNSTMIPVIANHYPDGGALKEYVHFFQIAKSDKFQQYDYGPVNNKYIYGQWQPPEYNLEKITAPISLHYGLNDYFVGAEDFRRLNRTLKSVVYSYEVPFRKFNHIDFLWGTESDVLLYHPTLKLMNRYL